jgi:serine/threonine-protein kinase
LWHIAAGVEPAEGRRPNGGTVLYSRQAVVQKIGRYHILERIGRGGVGTVFKAHDPMLDRLVAIKVISSDEEVTDELKTRFYREAQACARLIHPNIVVVHDLGEDQGRLYIVMEFLDGEELKTIINQRKPLSTRDKVSLMSQVCDGLHYAHEHGVIHRDIKPGNIFILRNGQVKILDFGIARIATSDSGLTRTGLIMGTLRYMSPEQTRGKVDYRSDMFSAGSVFYELLGYKAAFDYHDPMEALGKVQTEEPTPLSQIDPTIPAELVQIVERAHKKDPAQRFPDMGEMRTRLEQVRRRMGDEAEELPSPVRKLLDEIRGLQERLAAARAAAEQVGAARHAAAAWTEAETRAGEATHALEQHSYGTARDHFQQAVTAYERAATAARQAREAVPRAPARAEAPRDAVAKPSAPPARAEPAARPAAEVRQEAPEPRPPAREPAPAIPAVPATPVTPATAVRDQQAEVAHLRQLVAAARRAADEAGAARRAAATFARAKAAEQAAADAAGRQALDEAASRLRAAEQAYQEAAEEVRTAKSSAEQAVRDAGEAKQAAAALNLAGRAKWSAAQARDAAGRSAFGRGDWAAARILLEEASRLYDEAVREAGGEDRHKAAEAESARLREAVATARRAAEEAGAARTPTAQAALQAARAAEQAAETALARRAHDEARSQLRAAESAYQDAAREAAAQHAASAALAEARRLIAEGQADRAREPVARVRDADPDHPELPELEAAIERLVEKQKRGEQVQALLAQARRQQAQGDLSHALRSVEEALQLAPDDAGAARLRNALREAADTKPAPPAPVAPAVPGAPRARTPMPAMHAQPATPAARRIMDQGSAWRTLRLELWGWRFGPRELILAAVVGLLLVIGAGYAIWFRGPAAIPSVKVLETVREQVAEARRRADAAQAAGLAGGPWTKATAIERDAEATLARGDLARAEALFKEAEQAYRVAERDARLKQPASR